MTETKRQPRARSLKDGDWYWIARTVIQHYAGRVGPRALSVYNLLASLANSKERCYPSQKYLADRLRCSRSTIHKAIRVLEEAELIQVEKRSRYHLVYTLLAVRCRAGETQMSHRRNSDVASGVTNDNKRTRINNNIDIDMKNLDSVDRSTINRFNPRTKEELLALDLARGLNDMPGLPLYLHLARKFPEGALRRVLSEVRAIPDEKIRKSRGALFNHLMKKYERENLNFRD
jgi:DNA-binding MarR family transcriptional regulator